MKHTFLLISFFATTTSYAQTQIKPKDLGTLQLEFHSTSTSEAKDILGESLDITTKFLNLRFQQYFNATANGYFQEVKLAVADMDILPDNSVAIDFQGSAYFTREPLPTTSLLTSLVNNAFKGDAKLDYIKHLQASNIFFLQDLNYLVIGLNGYIISTEDVAALVQNTTNTNTTDTNDHSDKLSLIAIIGGACAAGLALCLISFVLCLMRRDYKRDNTTDNANTKTKAQERRGRDLAVVTKSRSNGSHKTDIESSSRSVSPLRSVLSQDSSVFTYNPSSSITPDNQSIAFSTDGTNAVESNILTADDNAFGNDISVIEVDKRDLSLIQEGENEEETPRKPRSVRRNKGESRSSKYKKEPVILFDSPMQYSKVPSSKKKTKQRFMNDSWYSEDDAASHYSDGSDVINDLNNLSRQVNKHRGSY